MATLSMSVGTPKKHKTKKGIKSSLYPFGNAMFLLRLLVDWFLKNLKCNLQHCILTNTKVDRFALEDFKQFRV